MPDRVREIADPTIHPQMVKRGKLKTLKHNKAEEQCEQIPTVS
jgi:hypothetical protein